MKDAPEPWLGVEVRHLAALRAVAEEGTFGAAALSLGYAQSAISQQIAALERYVGRRLFDRPGGARPVRLTRAGELLLEHAESILTRLAAARIDLDSLGDAESAGPLRVGAYQAVAGAILPLILQELGLEEGALGLELRESNDDRVLLDLLERGELDVAFAELPLPEGPLEATHLLDDPYVLVVPAGHRFGELDRVVSLEELSELPLIVLRSSSGDQRLRRVFAVRGLEPRVAYAVEDSVTLCGLVSGGVGCGLLPRLSAQLGGQALVTVPVEPALPPRSLAIAWHRDRLRTCTAGLFVDLAVEAAARLGEQVPTASA